METTQMRGTVIYSNIFSGAKRESYTNKTQDTKYDFDDKIPCDKCGHRVTVSRANKQKLVAQAFMDKVLVSDQMCFYYTGVPNRATLKFLFERVDHHTKDIKIWGAGKHNLIPGRVHGKGRIPYKISKF